MFAFFGHVKVTMYKSSMRSRDRRLQLKKHEVNGPTLMAHHHQGLTINGYLLTKHWYSDLRQASGAMTANELNRQSNFPLGFVWGGMEAPKLMCLADRVSRLQYRLDHFLCSYQMRG